MSEDASCGRHAFAKPFCLAGGNPIPSVSFCLGRRSSYPEQQLPGVPHELGAPQQPPGAGSVNFRDELLDVL